MTDLEKNHEKIQGHISEIISLAGEDVSREGLVKTPKRFATSFQALTRGYTQDVKKIVGDALYQTESSEMVIVKDIELYSLCEHHLLPFYGKAHVAYIPNEKIIGLSKIPRIVDVFSHRLQVQERMTTQIAETLMEVLKPQGVAVIIEAYHLCMMMRGVQKQNSKTLTSSVLGQFRDNPITRQELLHLLSGVSL